MSDTTTNWGDYMPRKDEKKRIAHRGRGKGIRGGKDVAKLRKIYQQTILPTAEPEFSPEEEGEEEDEQEEKAPPPPLPLEVEEETDDEKEEKKEKNFHKTLFLIKQNINMDERAVLSTLDEDIRVYAKIKFCELSVIYQQKQQMFEKYTYYKRTYDDIKLVEAPYRKDYREERKGLINKKKCMQNQLLSY